MFKIGDLVKCTLDGDVGIITKRDMLIDPVTGLEQDVVTVSWANFRCATQETLGDCWSKGVELLSAWS